jgi:hypothetical protein
MKNLHEGARLTISNRKCDLLYGESGDQKFHKFNQPNLSPSGFKFGANFLLKSPLNCSCAYTGARAQHLHRLQFAWIVKHRSSYRQGTSFGRKRYEHLRTGCAFQMQNGQIAKGSHF